MTTSARAAHRRTSGKAQAVTESGNPAVSAISELREVPLDKIDVPSRPARRFLGDVAALADSMQDYGLQQPISVRADGDRFILTSGLRRLAAARLLRWATITAFVRTVNTDQAYLLDLIENLQREDLTPEEEADALGQLIHTRGWTLQQVADGIKRSVGYVSKRVRIFDDPLLREAIVQRGLPVSTAEELLAADEAKRAGLLERAIAERWDQTRARQAMQLLDAESAASGAEVTQHGVSRQDVERPPLPAGRPRGFTRAIREFHQLISSAEATDLTEADRAALRALYRDLTMLARAPTTKQPRVFPPMPRVAPSTAHAQGHSRTPR